MHRTTRIARQATVALAAAFCLLLAACSGSSDRSGPPDLSEVTLKVGDQAGQQQALVQASGVLDGTPYRVQWAQFPAAAPLLEALRGGAIDIGVAGDAPTLNALAATDDLSIVEANRSPEHGGLAIVVPANSPIRGVADLRGKTVSPTTQGSIGHYLLLRALEEAGLSEKDVRISFLQPVDASSALASGAIDAWSTWDPYTAVAQVEQGARILRSSAGLTSGLSFLDANNESLADPSLRAAMTDFVRRYNEALRWAQANPEEHTRIYVELTRRPESVAGLVAQRARRTGIPLTPDVVTELQQVADNYQRFGVLRDRVPVSERVQDLSVAGS